MKKLILIALLIPSIAQASPATQYIRSGCANNGDGTTSDCAVSDGAAGAFNHIITWEAQNLTLDKNLTVYVLGTGPDTLSGALKYNGWTESTYRITITPYTGYRHSGALNTSLYYIERPAASTATSPVFAIDDANLTLDGLQIVNNASGNYDGDIVATVDNDKAGNFRLTNSILYIPASSKTGDQRRGIYIQNATGWQIINNIIYGAGSAGTSFRPNGAADTLIYNNTIIAPSATYARSALMLPIYSTCSGGVYVRVKNNILSGTGWQSYWQDGTGCSLETANNASNDAYSPNTSYRNATFTFVSSTDLHLQSSDTGALDRGADLSGTFSTDIDGQTRSGTWDIGADEYQASGPSLPLLKHAMEN